MQRILDKLKNRYTILIVIITLIFTIMGFKLAEITIIHGDEHRADADNTKVKKIPTPAPRGNITDVNGKVLAENRTGFTVQIMKDEFIENNKNTTSLKIMSLLEKQGENYVDEFPIILNSIDYKDQSDFFNEDSNINNDITNLLIKNNLIDDLLDMTYTHITDFNEYRFSVANRALSILSDSKEILELPITIDYTKENVTYNYKENENVEKWKEDLKLNKATNPKRDILELLLRDEERVKSLISHPIARKFAFELLNSNGKVNKYKLVDYKFSFDDDYRDIKKNLISYVDTRLNELVDSGLTEEVEIEIFGDKTPDLSLNQKNDTITMIKDKYPNLYPEINLDSSAKEDFVTLLKYQDFKSIMSFELEDEDNKISLGSKFLKWLKNKDIRVPFKYEPEDNKIFEFEDAKSKEKFLKENELEKDLSADSALEVFTKSRNFFDEFVSSESIKLYSQKFLLQSLNPKISISEWEYIPLINKDKWIERKNIKDYKNAKDVFEKLIKKSNIAYDEEITEELNVYENRFILLIDDILSLQGYRAYEPINIAYNVKDETIAMIKERSTSFPGINTSIDPVRYYPEGETSAHILGYLGKISQQEEIEKYINSGDYSRNDIIGKTGIEKQFEDYLDGKDGYRLIEIDAFGNTHRTNKEETPIPGNDVKLTIDHNLQKKAETILKKSIEKIQTGGTYQSDFGNYTYKKPYRNAKSGASVAINVKTGEVLAIANFPSYDPNLFSTGITLSDYNSLKPEDEKDPLAPRPLFNIALRSTVPPGSSFKMVPALAALDKGLNPNKKVNSLGYVQLADGRRQACWIWNDYRGRHGPTNMYQALEKSCNYYFYTLAAGRNLRTNKSLGLQVKVEDMQDMAIKLGLNDKTGVEIPEEKSGRVPNEEDKLAVANRSLRVILESKKDYLIEGEKLKDEDIDELIDKFSQWASKKDMSISEVYEELQKLNVKKDQLNSISEYLYYSYFREAGFRLYDGLNISIGQGENAYTTIGMANMVATIANGGYKNELTIIDDIKSYDNKDIGYKKKNKRERIKLKDYSELDDIKKGMLQVVESGSVRGIFSNFPTKVAGKTGTAQAGINPVTKDYYDSFAWFVGFAPYEDPEIAVATVVFQGGTSINAAPITRDIIGEYLRLNTKEEINNKK